MTSVVFMTSSPSYSPSLWGRVFWFPYLARCIEQVVKLLISPEDQTALIIPVELNPTLWSWSNRLMLCPSSKAEESPGKGLIKTGGFGPILPFF